MRYCMLYTELSLTSFFYIFHFRSGDRKLIQLDKTLSYDAVKLIATTQWGEQNSNVFRKFLDSDRQLEEELAQETKNSNDQIKSIMAEMDPKVLSALEDYLVDGVLEKYV